MWDGLDLFGKVLAVGVIIAGGCYLFLTIPYWYAIQNSVETNTPSNDGDRALAIVLWVASGLVLCVVGICGLYASIKMHESCLQQFSMVNIIMWIFGLLQLILFYVTLNHCKEDPPLFAGNPAATICTQQVDDLWFWIPNVLLMFFNACAACVGCGMKYKVSQTNPESKSLF
eukprot:TRINITY_DN3245_c0_g1_i2.p1 TRINITY_DN3245_c0_g1~~TRINITY_DN3245_c0_g1_i2.p1  ORF type:complete len:172 (+),score=19.69 TRINITY_DN3245_c0_g1_i2:37-552(+)